MKFIIQWFSAALIIVGTAYLLPGIYVEGVFSALVTALVLGVINAFVKPVILFLTLPINILTLGLFTLVINAALIMFTSMLVPGFGVVNFWWALLFGVILSVVMYGINKTTNNTRP